MDEQKSIYLIYEFLSEQGGLEREIINHANFLKKEGYKVKILTCHFDKKILKLLPFDGLKIESISKINTRMETLNLVLCFLGLNKLEKYNPNAFLSYSAPCNFLIRNKKTKRVNYINHFPHFLYLRGKEKIEWAKGTQGVKRWISVFLSFILGKLLRKVDLKLVKKNNLNFVNSKFTKKTLDKIYKLNSIVSYPPLDPRFRLSKKKINEKFIFSSSRIIPDKKYEWLIKSISYMKNKLPLYLAGSVNDNYKRKLINTAKDNKVKIKFLGKLTTEEIIKYYTSALAFAFATPKEDFGLVPVESLSCGTPVVIWGDGAGPTEQIIDGINGYYAKPYDLKDFANKLDLLIDNNLKSKNKKKIVDSSKKFSANYVKKDFVKKINEILK
ncbi:glycosyltransferase family 4 protein [Candidatus Pacearchaeota archaeon]|nr:glycosyltransferase family 4 protein [Candidatus Pacearchaeota archaeon]